MKRSFVRFYVRQISFVTGLICRPKKSAKIISQEIGYFRRCVTVIDRNLFCYERSDRDAREYYVFLRGSENLLCLVRH